MTLQPASSSGVPRSLYAGRARSDLIKADVRSTQAVCTAIVLALIALASTGCHTIRTTGEVAPDILATVPEGQVPVRLVTSDGFAAYEKKDRGHALADPQTYVLGPGLESYSAVYLGRAFALVTDPDQPIGQDGAWRYTIAPEVVDFDNTVEFGRQTQMLRLSLAATILDRQGERVDRVTSQADELRTMTMTGNTHDAEILLSELVQQAMADLSREAYLAIAPLEDLEIPEARGVQTRCGDLCARAATPDGEIPDLDEAHVSGYRELVVYDFAIGLLGADGTNSRADRLTEEAAEDLSNAIARDVVDAGDFETVRRSGPAGPGVLVLTGTITQLDAGSATARLLVGLGAGASGMEATVEARDGESGRLLGRKAIDESSYIFGGLVGATMGLQSHLNAAASAIARDVSTAHERGAEATE